jgi:pyruvate dehydrogenase E1 component alpha subunit
MQTSMGFAQSSTSAEPDRVIGDGDGVPDGRVDDLSPQQLLELYRWMVLLRTYDERSLVYHRQGRIGTYAIFWGHEAIQAGAAYALDPDDWIFPSYRESAIGLVRGMRPSTVLAWWRGHPAGWWDPREHRVASVCVPIATHVPHAAGLAWGLRLRGRRDCALVFFGDGATSEGSFHEGVNFAGVTGAPLVLVCNNNAWAISTPVEEQTRAARLVDKAPGYGIPGVRVDGGDVLAVYAAARDAVARARAGDGPTLIEAVHHRAAPHATADDPSIYVDPARVEEARRGECLARYESYLRRTGVLSDAAEEQAREQALAAMREAIAEAEALPPPEPSLVFDTAYADPPPELVAERAELLELIARGEA